MAFKFPGMGFLSMFGGGGDSSSMPPMGGFGQMLGDFLKSPNQGASSSSSPSPTPSPTPSPGGLSSMLPGGGVSAPPSASPAPTGSFASQEAIINDLISRSPQHADLLRQFLAAIQPGGMAFRPSGTSYND